MMRSYTTLHYTPKPKTSKDMCFFHMFKSPDKQVNMIPARVCNILKFNMCVVCNDSLNLQIWHDMISLYEPCYKLSCIASCIEVTFKQCFEGLSWKTIGDALKNDTLGHTCSCKYYRVFNLWIDFESSAKIAILCDGVLDFLLRKGMHCLHWDLLCV